MVSQSRGGSHSARNKNKRRHLLERLESRVVLNAAPVAVADPWYDTPLETTLVVGSSGTTLLANDWDPEGDSISASLVSGPANGTLSAFQSNGTFTYVPDTSFSGFDSFSYKVNDGSADSNIVTVSIAVDGDFGARTNQEEAPRDSFLLSGGLEFTESITPSVALVHQSNTIPRPIVAIETSLLSGSTVPDVRRQLGRLFSDN
jgi:Bacterial Ig domain